MCTCVVLCAMGCFAHGKGEQLLATYGRCVCVHGRCVCADMFEGEDNKAKAKPNAKNGHATEDNKAKTNTQGV